MSELPGIMERDQEIRLFILDITKDRYADREKTDDRIDRILDELKRDREKSDIKWEAQEKKWEAQEKKWEAQEKKWEAWERKWEEERRDQAAKWKAQEEKWEAWERKWEEERRDQAAKWKAQEEKWEEERRDQAAKWKAQEEKWEENQKTIREMLASVKALDKKHDSTIGALGARWGLRSEGAFRKGLKSILEDSFGVKVERYQDFDHEGVVFGQPDQIEMDVIIHNGTLILCEIKSSLSKSDMYTFWRKKNFYENKHQRKANRTIVLSPMVDKAASDAAEKLGIEIFGYADEVELDD
ncbi:MAG: DUF3782 domain-containing protein [Desulfobacterales bacterium]|nr:DUF3782 domain-containing protein [Desulfobacterales bacterium]